MTERTGRGKRTPRLTMFARLFAIVWSAILCGITFLALLGMTIGVGVAFIGTLGGVGLVVIVGWFIVNTFADATHRHNRNYQLFRKSGGDPYFDWTWFWPLNTDPDHIRNSGGNLATCPNCGQCFHGHTCPSCHADHMEFVRCSACDNFTHDPGRAYESATGIICAHCGSWLRDPNAIVQRTGLDPRFTTHLADQQNPRIFEG